ncbi:MAG: hypothetical protein BZY73_06570 [SAR202 cluster bacterium Casp-Chloro-G3]|nr:DUF4392 domain-containing protein [Chloroflexota bacterium]PKB56807.1 MAG: hypothetical protein BZY73_06570 [SAR202 cluster bacterium Casp-Chloro-G3]
MSDTIEDIILDHDQRGVSALRPHLPGDFCTQAAQYILDHPGDALIATGFYILSAGKHETDGPPGAIAIGNALQALGRKVGYVADIHTVPMLRDWLGDKSQVIEFPIADVATSRREANEILKRLKPGLLVSIERCSRTSSDAYLNMRSVEITQHTARLDYLFESGIPSLGIGDGGNEIGMGNLAAIIPTVDKLPDDPAVTRVDQLVIASVSNWGGYGLVAALSCLVGRNLLPPIEADRRLIERMVDTGAVDGTTGESKYYVDNFTLEENAEVLGKLHRLVEGYIG